MTDARTDGRTDGWTDRREGGNSGLDLHHRFKVENTVALSNSCLESLPAHFVRLTHFVPLLTAFFLFQMEKRTKSNKHDKIGL